MNPIPPSHVCRRCGHLVDINYQKVCPECGQETGNARSCARQKWIDRLYVRMPLVLAVIVFAVVLIICRPSIREKYRTELYEINGHQIEIWDRRLGLEFCRFSGLSIEFPRKSGIKIIAIPVPTGTLSTRSIELAVAGSRRQSFSSAQISDIESSVGKHDTKLILDIIQSHNDNQWSRLNNRVGDAPFGVFYALIRSSTSGTRVLVHLPVIITLGLSLMMVAALLLVPRMRD